MFWNGGVFRNIHSCNNWFTGLFLAQHENKDILTSGSSSQCFFLRWIHIECGIWTDTGWKCSVVGVLSHVSGACGGRPPEDWTSIDRALVLSPKISPSNLFRLFGRYRSRRCRWGWCRWRRASLLQALSRQVRGKGHRQQGDQNGLPVEKKTAKQGGDDARVVCGAGGE